jgi:tetratricopeptide (TPR) repeat protein
VLRAAAFLPSGGQRELTEHLFGELDQRALADPAIAAPWHKAWGLMTLGIQPGVAAHHFERSLEAFEAIANFRETFEARLNVAAALGTVGKLEESEGHFRELLAVAERMNLQSLEPVMLQNLGIIRADLGALDDAAGLIAAALVAARRQGDPRVEGNCHHTLGVIDTRAGRFRSAEEHARAAVVNAVAAVRPLAIAGLAEALLGQHRIAEALEQARQANRILEEQGYVEDGEALVRLSLAECLVAAGDPVAAREAGLRAYRRLLERAAAIEEPELRASFLTALPDHRRTVDLARQLGLAGDPN